MNLILFGATLAGLVLALAFVVVFRKLLSPRKCLPPQGAWLDGLSVDRYRPMERLLDDEDYRFLASQPGFSPKLGRCLRAQRRKAFRGYLRCLRRDFDRICVAIQLLLVNAQQDRPDLAATLFKQRALFAGGLLMVECRLLLHACGWGTVDVRNLIAVLDTMRVELRQLTPAAVSASA
jgi:hypothetical protein